MSEQTQFMLTILGAFGSTSWVLFQFTLKRMGEQHQEMRRWIQDQFEQYDQQRKIAGESWKEVIRTMQSFDNRIDKRLDTVEHWLGRLEDCYCKGVNDPPSGYP